MLRADVAIGSLPPLFRKVQHPVMKRQITIIFNSRLLADQLLLLVPDTILIK